MPPSAHLVAWERFMAYAGAVSGLADKASGEIAAAFTQALSEGQDVRALEAHLASAIDAAVAKHGAAAAQEAVRLMEEYLPGLLGAAPDYAAYDNVNAARSQRQAASALALMPAGGPDAVAARLAEAVGRYVRNASRETVIRTAERNGLRWARVPTGSYTCGFCIMLASRGFVYRSQASAGGLGGWHSHCNCQVIASNDTDNLLLEGYDPDRLYEAYTDAAATIGSTDPKRIGKELELRTVEWIRFGQPAEVEYDKKRKKLYESECDSIDVLSEGHGIPLTVLKEDRGAKANIDLMIHGELWEEKSPAGSTRPSVFATLVKTVSKWDRLGLSTPVRLVYSNRRGTRDDGTVLGEVANMMRELGIAEVLFIQKDGSIRRLK
ncbi:MAG: hypothetical protein LBG81_05650 [Coriobacteriaceae bacterium]|jgi:hypothetical protein|nr:hypothetical protein [Coriobacteriaceae bacterium]